MLYIHSITSSQQKPESDVDREKSVALKVNNIMETMSTIEKRLQALNDQSMKLEKMMINFSHEHERHLEPGRHE